MSKTMYSFSFFGVTRLVIAIVVVWLLILFIISGPLRNHSNNSNTSNDIILARLSRANNELALLKAQNEELRMLIENYLPKDLKISEIQKDESQYPSQDFELARRRISFNIDELWHYLRNTKNSSIIRFANEIRDNLLYDLEIVENRDAKWRNHQLNQLAKLVQDKIKKLQNPDGQLCSRTKKLVCQLNKGCGFGCQIHHLTYCMIVAMATKRTLIMDSTNWRYTHSNSKTDDNQGWDSVFLPLSNTCLDDEGSSRSSWTNNDQLDSFQVIDLPIIDTLRPRPPYLPLAIPEEISDKLITLHGSPIVWFIGEIVKYIMRPSEEMLNLIKEKKEQFKFNSPIVGVHVRRTDKVGTEASFHPLSEYMNFVEKYYNKLELFNTRGKKNERIQRLVYLATDEPSIWSKEVKEYEDKGYVFLGDSSIAKTASVGRRYSIDSLKNIILDIWLLSETNHLVCTFSSQVCRLAYELMQTRDPTFANEKPDRHDFFNSLDDIYYFGGQSGHNQIAILNHKAQSDKEISFQIGDVIGIAGNHWNGYSKGLNKNNHQEGLYPGFKTIESIVKSHFKIFQDE